MADKNSNPSDAVSLKEMETRFAALKAQYLKDVAQLDHSKRTIQSEIAEFKASALPLNEIHNHLIGRSLSDIQREGYMVGPSFSKESAIYKTLTEGLSGHYSAYRVDPAEDPSKPRQKQFGRLMTQILVDRTKHVVGVMVLDGPSERDYLTLVGRKNGTQHTIDIVDNGPDNTQHKTIQYDTETLRLNITAQQAAGDTIDKESKQLPDIRALEEKIAKEIAEGKQLKEAIALYKHEHPHVNDADHTASTPKKTSGSVQSQAESASENKPSEATATTPTPGTPKTTDTATTPNDTKTGRTSLWLLLGAIILAVLGGGGLLSSQSGVGSALSFVALLGTAGLGVGAIMNAGSNLFGTQSNAPKAEEGGTKALTVEPAQGQAKEQEVNTSMPHTAPQTPETPKPKLDLAKGR